MGEKIDVELQQCLETVLIASDTALIEIDPLESDSAIVIIHVDGNHFNLEHHPVFCSGFVRAHLISPGPYTLRYQHLR
jgi:hypothetical protein